jgi:hypothetical protein
LFDNGVWRYRNVNNTLGWRELTPEVCKIKWAARGDRKITLFCW